MGVILPLEDPMDEAALKQDRFTYQEYLELEERSDERHIFWDGEIFAMAGGSPAHVALETSLILTLGATLKGRPCRPRVGNQRLRAPEGDRCVYADATVVCGPLTFHPDDGTALTNPVVVFEVLSRSTEAFDRGEKFAYYRTFPSLRSVVLISQRPHRVERYSRDARGVWSLTDLGPQDTLDLPEIDAEISLAEMYAGAELSEESEAG